MKTLFTLHLIAFIFCNATAQTKVSGRITDSKNSGIPLANVFVEGSYDGATSDENGIFSFVTDARGKNIVVVSLVGFVEVKREVNLDGTAIDLAIEMHEAINELNTVTISAGSFTAGDEGRRTTFRALDIATTAGATADIAGALNTLPGTQKVGETGRLFVRGGDSNEARTFIDGMVVLDAYSPSAPNTPSRGRFLPFMFKGTSFSTGGYSAEYGQALSSALALDSKDESATTQTDIGLLSVGGDVAHTQAWKGGSAAGKIQYTNLDPYVGLIKQNIDWTNAPTSVEAVAAIRQKVRDTGMFKAYSNFNRSRFALNNHGIDDPGLTQHYALSNNYSYFNSSYRTAFNGDWISRSGLSYTSIDNDMTIGNQGVTESQKGLHAKSVIEGSLTDRLELKTGIEAIGRSYRYAQASFDETITSLFSEVDAYVSNNFVARAGGRMEMNSLFRKMILDPRFSLAYKAGINGQVSLAYGTFHQSPPNNLLRAYEHVGPEKAQHFIANYQHVDDNRTFRVEAYYKKYSDLVKIYAAGSADNSGHGFAQGVELFWRDRKSVKYLDYWISYSLLDTRRYYLNFPAQAVPAFASRHNLSAVVKYFVVKWKSQLGTTFSIASGRPYNNPNEEKFNNSRTSQYQDLSLNWSYLPRPQLIIYLSCTNLLGHNNVFGYEFSNKQNADGIYNSRAIRQPAPRFLFVGVFITLSKDKTINQLPSL